MEASKYKVSVVKFQGKIKPIVCEKSNKCSALVALTNFFFLSGPEVVASYVSETADQNYLTSQIVASIENFFLSAPSNKLKISKEDCIYAANSPSSKLTRSH